MGCCAFIFTVKEHNINRRIGKCKAYTVLATCRSEIGGKIYTTF